MPKISEVIYRKRDNTIDLLLKVNTLSDPIKRVFDLTDVTRMVLVRKDGFKVDSAKTSIFDFTTLATSGIVTIKLGLIDVKPGKDLWRLIVFDATNTNGLTWGDEFYINVKEEYAEL